MTSRTDRSIPELFSDAVCQLAKLIGNEFALARAELAETAGQAGRATAMMGAGAVIMIPALVLLLFATAAALMHAGLSDRWRRRRDRIDRPYRGRDQPLVRRCDEADGDD